MTHLRAGPARSSAVLATLLIGVAGCQTAPPEAPFAAGAVVSPDLAGAIQWRTEPAPLDESPAPAGTLTLAGATARVLGADPRIQAALAKVRVAQAEAHQTRLLPNPVLTVVVRVATAGGQPAIEANLAADLLAYLQRSGRISAADRRLRAASSEALAAVLEAWGDAQDHFLAVQVAEARGRLLEESLAVTRRFLGLAENRLKVGEAIRLDVSSLRAEELDFQLRLADARLDLRRERLTLERLLGQPSGDAPWQLPPLADPFDGAIDERQAVRAALEHRPQLQAQVWELGALGVDARLARWYLVEGVVPSIDAQRDPDWGVGPSLEIPLPIFDWGQARRAKADAAVGQAGHELLSARRLVVEETRRALATFNESRVTLRRVRDELIPLQRQRREDAEAAYRAGQSEVTALLLAERDIQDTLAKYADLQQRTQAALVDLQRAVGGPAVLSALATAPSESAPGPVPPTTSPNR